VKTSDNNHPILDEYIISEISNLLKTPDCSSLAP